MKKDKAEKFFLVVGMHRSGTSCLTGVLERCGVRLGNVRKGGLFNKKGYFEIREVQQIHDQILALNRGNWYNPPENIIVHPVHRQQLIEISQQLKQHQFAALKDPRSILILDTWKEIIGSSYQLIGTFRHPLAVGHSIATRNHLSLEQGLTAWIAYNKRLVQAHQENQFPLIQFDLSNPQHYLRNVIAVAEQLGLKPKQRRIRRFIEANLAHHHFEAQDIPDECKVLYDYLLQKQFVVTD